jgi:hypothetical protein
VNRIEDKVRNLADLQLLHDPGAVRAAGRNADIQNVGTFPGGLSLDDQLQGQAVPVSIRWILWLRQPCI